MVWTKRTSGVPVTIVCIQLLVDAEEIEELRQVGRVPFAAQIGFRDSDVAAAQQPRRKAVVVDLHGGGRSRTVAAEPDHAAVGQGYVERAVLQFRTETQRQPDHAGQFGKQRRLRYPM